MITRITVTNTFFASYRDFDVNKCTLFPSNILQQNCISNKICCSGTGL